MTVAIVKYGMGNVASVQKALNKLGYHSVITDDHKEIEQSNFIILPGVGSFKRGMENLLEANLIKLLNNVVVQDKKPFLGICLGMQLVATYGNEPEKVKGLGWIDGEVVKIESSEKIKVPHLGWNTIKTKGNNEIYSEFNGRDYYFIHSYHFKPNNPKEVVMTVNYNGAMVAALQKGNIYAMQFHPEKSQEVGMKLLQKVLNQYA